MIVQKTARNQHTVTIPRRLCEALGIKQGDEIFWKINKQGRLEMELWVN